MKKIFVMAIAAAAISFASCTDKQAKPVVEEVVDSTEVTLERAGIEADNAISALSEQLEANSGDRKGQGG